MELPIDISCLPLYAISGVWTMAKWTEPGCNVYLQIQQPVHNGVHYIDTTWIIAQCLLIYSIDDHLKCKCRIEIIAMGAPEHLSVGHFESQEKLNP